ncbi:MAG TPA: hypothetical protein VFZ89_06370 [Solirubrobacteraceae bacterium]
MAAFVVPGAAQAQTPVRALPAPVDDEPRVSVALAGADVLVGYTTARGGAVVEASPVGGGSARRLLTVPAPRGRQMGVQIAASRERVAVLATEIDDSDGPPAPVTVFTGPPTGPLVELADDPGSGWSPIDAWVDGPRTALLDIGGGYRKLRLRVVEGDRQIVAALPESAIPQDVAGDLVAYATQVPGGDEELARLVVAEWRTGALRYEITTSHADETDLHPDGSMLVNGAVIRPPGTTAALLRTPIPLQWAGSRIVGRRESLESGFARVGIVENRRLRAVGWPTLRAGTLVADAERMAWVAGACLMVAPLDGRALSAPPRGPCGRSEATASTQPPGRGGSHVVRDGAIRIHVRCAIAPSRGCRGTLRLDGGTTLGRGRYAIAPRKSRWVRVRLTARGRRVARGGGELISLRIHERDGLGLTHHGNAVTIVARRR